MEDQQHQHENHTAGSAIHRTLVIHGYRPDYDIPRVSTTDTNDHYRMDSPFVPKEQMI
jgi:hypothetical protein